MVTAPGSDIAPRRAAAAGCRHHAGRAVGWKAPYLPLLGFSGAFFQALAACVVWWKRGRVDRKGGKKGEFHQLEMERATHMGGPPQLNSTQSQ